MAPSSRFVSSLPTLIFLLGGCETIPLRGGDSGGTREMKPGETFELVLAGNPQTNSRWWIVDLDTSVLRQKGKMEYESRATGFGYSSMVEYTWTMEAVGRGTTTLRMVYAQSETAVPSDTFVLKVVVR